MSRHPIHFAAPAAARAHALDFGPGSSTDVWGSHDVEHHRSDDPSVCRHCAVASPEYLFGFCPNCGARA